MLRFLPYLVVSSLLSAELTGAEVPSAAQVNDALGLALFDESGALWEQDTDAVAQRLGWKPESRTSTSTSFRDYPKADARILGVRPFSLALYGEEGTVDSVSMLFANKGDVDQLIAVDPSLSEARQEREKQRARQDFGRLIRRDAVLLEQKLNELFGHSSGQRFGETRDMRERVSRWDWKGHSFLLASPRDEYLALRIVSPGVADGTRLERVSKADMRERLAQRVERRENGDILLKDMPMVDQGPKGYCVPATWERVLRYMGIPADMYILAMAGDTNVGGGTSTRSMAMGASELVRRYGRRITPQKSRLDLRLVSRYIDQGLPLLWTMYVDRAVDAAISMRSRQRTQVSDWEDWKKSLEEVRRQARRSRPDTSEGHVRLIIGYNRETGEIAISDSWGPNYAERWVTLEEAEVMSEGNFMVIEI
jgi:hypothetical protein